tara:strand:- start:940 stop:1407 length:468 start_codon:yes stop_codon:yes gene_type:complete
MSVKIKAKNPSNLLQTLTCNTLGHLNTTGGGGGSTDMTTTNNHLSNIEGKTYIRTKNNLTSNGVIGQNTASSVFDLSTNISSLVRLWGSSDTHHDMILEFSNDNSNWISVDIIHVLNINSNSSFNLIINNPPKYIRLFNNHSQSIILDAFLELFL